jgi:hypothetical protein
MTIKIEKISASKYKVTNTDIYIPVSHYFDTKRRQVSKTPCFLSYHNQPMTNDDWETLKLWCKAQDLPFPNSEPEPTTDTLPVVKRGVPADSVNVTLANADKGQYRIEWRNSESGKTRFIVHCYGCANSLQVARGIAFAQCAKVTHPMSKPENDLSDHP